MRRKLAAGNWKMHGLSPIWARPRLLSESHPDPACEVILCPPATLISRMWELLIGSAIGWRAGLPPRGEGCAYRRHLGGDAGRCRRGHVILGHSERRADHHETDALVAAKARAAHAAGLVAILCLGETEAERDAGRRSR
jgi:triosephosphate isomerase (TIM)